MDHRSITGFWGFFPSVAIPILVALVGIAMFCCRSYTFQQVPRPLSKRGTGRRALGLLDGAGAAVRVHLDAFAEDWCTKSYSGRPRGLPHGDGSHKG